MQAECHFYIEIVAPRGLAGVEPHLELCGMKLWPWVSGFNGQVILRHGPDDERLDFVMNPSTTETMDASGDFPHRLALDDRHGNLFKQMEHQMAAF